MEDLPCFGPYSLLFEIGSGAYSTVYYATSEDDGSNAAIKVINKSSIGGDTDKIVKEIDAMKCLYHPCIVRLQGVIESQNDDRIGLVMDFCSNGSLASFIQPGIGMTENHVLSYFLQIMSAVDYLHNYKNIIHRDIKADNILLDVKFRAKLTDFGLSAKLKNSNQMMKTNCGSPIYAAPEIIIGKQLYTSSCDIWSCGVLLYYMATGNFPFFGENIQILFHKICQGEFVFTNNLTSELKDLINRMLQVDPEKRIKLIDIFNHSWVRKGVNAKIPIQIETDKEMKKEVVKALKEEYGKMGVDFTGVMMNVKNGDPRTMATYSIILKFVFETKNLKMNAINPMSRRTVSLAKMEKVEREPRILCQRHATINSISSFHPSFATRQIQNK